MSTTIEKLIKEIKQEPELALQLADTLQKIAGTWIEEPSQIIMRNMLGQELANISLAYPKWRVIINGEPAKDAPFASHVKDGLVAKLFAEEKLRELGYIVRSSGSANSE